MTLPPPTIVIDTREQTPWIAWIKRGDRRLLLPVVRRKLEVGDYSIEGYADEIAIERKSLADWIGTMFSSVQTSEGPATSWERFRRELARARDGVYPEDGSPPTIPLQRFAILVEGSRADVLAHRYRSEVHPNSVLGRSDSIFADYGYPVLWSYHDAGAGAFGDPDFSAARADAERLAMWTLVRWWERRSLEKGATAADITAAFALARRGVPQEPRAPKARTRAA